MTTATTGEARVEIDSAPLTVYQLISDITRMGDWSPECYRCEWLNGATTAATGARFRGHNRLGKVRWHTDAIITVADPGREFAFTTLHKEGREERLWRYELRKVGAGTEVIESYRFLWCPIANRIAELPIPRVICHKDGTTGLPQAWDHLVGSACMVVSRRAGVNRGLLTAPVGLAFNDEFVRG